MTGDKTIKLSHVKNRIEQQFILMNLIANSLDNLTKVGLSNITVQRVQACLTSIKDNWEKFSVSHDAIGLAISELDSVDQLQLNENEYFSENLYSMTHESYLEAVERMSIILDSVQKTLPRTPSSQSLSQASSFPTFYRHARLPRIDLPKFNGIPSEWLSFKDLFTSLVLNNPTLGSVEKLQYLKTSLIGSAAHLLKNTTLTANNFQKAWEALISFYENKRLLVNAALHSLLSLKRMTKESSSEMEQLYTMHCWDDFLVFVAVQRLDSESVRAWEQHLGSSKEPPTWTQFTEFLFTRLHSLQAFEKSRGGKNPLQSQQQTIKTHYQGRTKDSNANNINSCSICSAKHYTTSCPQYINKTIQQRLAIVSKHKLCYNCLGHHRVSACRITKRCHKCGRKHHTTIHQNNPQSSNSESNKSTTKESTVTSSKSTDAQVLHSTSAQTTSSLVLLATAQVIIISETGEQSRVRALIDQGSEISLISERIVQQLRLPRTKSSLSLIGIGARKSGTTRDMSLFKLKNSDGDFEQSLSAHILPKLTTSIPSMKVENPDWPHLKGLKLADPNFKFPGTIDLILGVDIYSQIIESGLKKGEGSEPIAQLTKFGWIISGPSSFTSSSFSPQSYHISVDQELHELLHKFGN
ncbi:uncharacterized protein LOC114939494 [Nylanderia fulva]|uniref:uncharacterized protein LOC114939494 n=1 Tax=Nylanderia fulva TaxID=613905 RepID=UPI0010FACFC5|nr:uncharacterized protein LOC114939494 [Nylanderia fulva]